MHANGVFCFFSQREVCVRVVNHMGGGFKDESKREYVCVCVLMNLNENRGEKWSVVDRRNQKVVVIARKN